MIKHTKSSTKKILDPFVVGFFVLFAAIIGWGVWLHFDNQKPVYIVTEFDEVGRLRETVVTKTLEFQPETGFLEVRDLDRGEAVRVLKGAVIVEPYYSHNISDSK